MKHHNVKFRFIILEYIILKVPVLRGTYANNYEILHRLSFPIIRCHRYGCNTCYGGKYTSFLNDQPTDNDYAFLGNYSLKMIYCDANEITSSEAGTDYGSIVFRLCPSTGECIDDFGSVGCDAGYGDFLVGINTFVKAYLEHKRDEIQVVNDNFQIEEMVRMPSIQIRYGR